MTLVGALRGWPARASLVLLVLGLGALAGWTRAVRARREIGDRVAAAIDRDAGLQGELRSASWFASRDGRDAWIDWHLERAAARLADLEWPRVYPPVVDRRAQATTGVLTVAALLLPMALPGLPGGILIYKETRPALRPLGTRPLAAAIPTGLPEELEAFLAQAENGTVRLDAAGDPAAVRRLIDKLSQVHDAASLKALARATGPKPETAPRSTDAAMKTLAERADRAAQNAAVPPPMRDALEDLADDLTKAADAERAANGDPRETRPSRRPQDGDAAQANASPRHQEPSIQSVRDPDSGGGAAVLMVADPNAIGRDPGTGLGGGSGADAQNGAMPDLGRALRSETVEASANTDGSDTLTERRRRSERGEATVTFTRSAPRAFDRGRASAPPAVPEERRSAVQSYFVRQQ